MAENKKNKIVVEDIDIIVSGIKNNPYYEIKYREVGKDYYNIGCGSYHLNNVFEWKDEYFELVTKKETKNVTETKQEVTNEMLLEHLNEIENSIGVSQTWLMTINKMMMLRKDKLNLDSEELLTLKTAEIALRLSVDNMQSVSGLKERIEEVKEPDIFELLFGLQS